MKTEGSGYRVGSKGAGRIRHQKVLIDGIVFDSKAEAGRYRELRILQRAHKITALEVHPHYDLIPAQQAAFPKKTLRAHGYTADFRYVDDKGRVRVEDVKSAYSRKEKDFSINRKLMLMLHGIYVEEVIV